MVLTALKTKVHHRSERYYNEVEKLELHESTDLDIVSSEHPSTSIENLVIKIKHAIIKPHNVIWLPKGHY